jgi:hypothetical protein
MRGAASGTPAAPQRATSSDWCNYLNPGVNFGQVRKILRPFIGLSPSFPLLERASSKEKPDVPFGVKWDRRRAPTCGSPSWRYLTEVRRLPAAIVATAISAGVLREGPYASAWFAHRDHDGQLTEIEIRGPDYRGFTPGGSKTLFRLPGPLALLRLAARPDDFQFDEAFRRTCNTPLRGLGPKALEAIHDEATFRVGGLRRMPGFLEQRWIGGVGRDDMIDKTARDRLSGLVQPEISGPPLWLLPRYPLTIVERNLFGDPAAHRLACRSQQRAAQAEYAGPRAPSSDIYPDRGVGRSAIIVALRHRTPTVSPRIHAR